MLLATLENPAVQNNTGSAPMAVGAALSDLIEERRRSGRCRTVAQWIHDARATLGRRLARRHSKRRQNDAARILSAFSAMADLIEYRTSTDAQSASRESWPVRSRRTTTRLPQRSRRIAHFCAAARNSR
jgi:hypothetical protein